MKKIDYKKEFHSLYTPSTKSISIVEVPSMSYVLIDGKGDPNTVKEYGEAVEALYIVSYTIKFFYKKQKNGIDYTVLPLEGLWWVPNMEQFSSKKKEDWLWRMMIMQPEFVTAEVFKNAVEIVRQKKNPVALDKLTFGTYDEGKCAQILHVGPYSAEGPTIDRLHTFIAKQGYTRTGKHHEIYLNDPRKSASEKLKTIIRQPVVIK
ncbi:MAG: GyrI-like domain-containing protein [Bacteroidetes bacterium]|nr:GyrI-like domain-containing protein [Bacteroidota bacterium]